MTDPLIISTWSFGQRANSAAWPVLERGGSSLDAVEAGCRAVEADPGVDSVGYGGLPDANGEMTLDACIMRSPRECGSVCAVAGYLHPVSIARKVMEDTNHVLLAGPGAEAFAAAQGFARTNLLSDTARDAYADRRPHRSHDTIGVLALDAVGELAGACSTSGLAYKLPGRVGDSPIVGHGLYVDPDVAAVAATGDGELLMRTCAAFLAVEQMRAGAAPVDALRAVLDRVMAVCDVGPEDQVALLALDRDGGWASVALRSSYQTAIRHGTRDEVVPPERVLIG